MSLLYNSQSYFTTQLRQYLSYDSVQHVNAIFCRVKLKITWRVIFNIMYGWPQSWKLQLLSYAEDKHGINDLLLRYMYDITISTKTLPLLEEHQLVFYITYKLLKSNPKKPKDKHGSLYYLNPSLNSSGEEIQSWDLQNRFIF